MTVISYLFHLSNWYELDFCSNVYKCDLGQVPEACRLFPFILSCGLSPQASKPCDVLDYARLLDITFNALVAHINSLSVRPHPSAALQR